MFVERSERESGPGGSGLRGAAMLFVLSAVGEMYPSATQSRQGVLTSGALPLSLCTLPRFHSPLEGAAAKRAGFFK